MGAFHYTASLLRPFLRRAFRTALPERVLILLRKPCSLLYCLFLGWYVLFIPTPPNSNFKYTIRIICLSTLNVKKISAERGIYPYFLWINRFP